MFQKLIYVSYPWKHFCYDFDGQKFGRRLHYKLENGLFLVSVDRFCVLWIYIFERILKNELFKGVDSKGSLHTYVTATTCRACKQFQISTTSVKLGQGWYARVNRYDLKPWATNRTWLFWDCKAIKIGYETYRIFVKILPISRSWNELKT